MTPPTTILTIVSKLRTNPAAHPMSRLEERAHQDKLMTPITPIYTDSATSILSQTVRQRQSGSEEARVLLG